MNIERYFSSKLRPFGSNSKPVKLRNEKHLKWVRNQECIVTGTSGKGLVAAHHVQRKSHIVNDYAAVPLSHLEHGELHSDSVEEYEQNQGIDFKDALIATLIERIIFLQERVGR